MPNSIINQCTSSPLNNEYTNYISVECVDKRFKEEQVYARTRILSSIEIYEKAKSLIFLEVPLLDNADLVHRLTANVIKIPTTSYVRTNTNRSHYWASKAIIIRFNTSVTHKAQKLTCLLGSLDLSADRNAIAIK